MFLRGSINMGATKAHAASEAKSKGIFFTTDPSVAQEYASGVSSGENTTLMDEIKGDENLYMKELPRKYFRGWGPAKDYILRHFQSYGNGLRLVGLDADGNEVSRISDAETFSLQTNAATDEQFRKEGWFAEEKWRELASFPKTKQGLEDFNYQLGDIIRENKLGIRGYGKYFLTSDNTLVVDARGDDYHGIRSDALPGALQNGDPYVHIDSIAERAFQNGYDAVVVKNVDDAGGAQTQYIVKDSNQVMYDAVMSGDIAEPKMEMEYSKYGDKVKKALTDLADYSEDYAFLPSDYKPSSYTDPKNKNKEYVLDDAAKAKYRELYDEEYASVMEAVIKSSKYRSASAEKRAELLEAARDDVAPQVKEEFLKWLAKNYKSTPKKK